MKSTPLSIPDVLLLEPRVFPDERGLFFESFNEKTFRHLTGLDCRFVQDNQSRSTRHVLRGLHYQVAPRAQGKLVRVTRGAVFDVAVDLRRESPTFGHWVSAVLSESNNYQLWIPEGFAHGFQVLSDHADVLYKMTDFYAPGHERCLRWDDPVLAIDWPCRSPVLSATDREGCSLDRLDIHASRPGQLQDLP